MSLQEVFATMQEKNIVVSELDGELVIRAPQGAMDQALMDRLKVHKQRLLAALRDCTVIEGHAPTAPKITPDMLPLVSLTQDEIDLIVDSVAEGAAGIQDIYPLAPLQEGILFHHLLETQGDPYITRSIIVFDKRTRLDAFLDALQTVINRHDILRSSVRWDGLQQPVQVVHRNAPLPVEELAAVEKDKIQQRLLERTDPRRLRMSLQQAPLLAGYVVQDSRSDECWFALLNHHMVDDNYTLQLILSEIRLLLSGQAEQLPPIQPYRNFIAQMRADSATDHQRYFRRQLGDIDEPTAPFGLLNVQGSGGQVSEAVLSLDEDLAQRIRNSARQHSVTPASLFHLAWALVLGQCSDRSDVVFGTVLSGRLQGGSGADQAVGMFINTLPIRVSLRGRTVREILGITHRNLNELLMHEQASLALAQRCSAVPASTPLFTALINYRHSNMIVASDQSALLEWEGMRVISSEERSNYPLTLSVDDLGQGFGLTVQSIGGIDPARIAEYLRTAVEGLVTALEQNPRQLANTIGIMPEAERRQVLFDFNATAAVNADELRISPKITSSYGSHAPRGNPVGDAPASRTAERFKMHSHAERGNDKIRFREVIADQTLSLHALFETQVNKTPHADAVAFAGRTLSYAELNAKANRLARYLRAKGVGPEVPVGLCVERSLDMAIGMMGILKAGGAYVPLDPQYPEQRIAYMLQDARIDVLLSHQGLAAALPHNAKEIICLDSDWPAIAQCPADNPEPRNHPLDLAYIIYTSGSTGRPKGAMVSHRNAVHSTGARFAGYREQVTCYLLLSSFAFDSSVAGLFWTLGQGGCLCLPSDDAVKDPAALVELIALHRVSHLLALPSFYALLLNQAGAELQSLKTAIVAGEACSTEVVKQHYALLPGVRLYNEYGPTEATVWSSVYWASPDDLDRPLSIGRPINNARLYILDRSGNPVPIGVPGELHIGGEGIVRGYWRRPELSAEKFIPDPFMSNGGRLYKTGDLAQYRPDGNVEFLGRIDHQVKIRGFRIELGEIEAKLLEMPEIDKAAVIAREDRPGDKRLIAYLVAVKEPAVNLDQVKARLKAALPDYMVPAAFVLLDSLPLGANGKLDYKRLPQPDMSGQSAQHYQQAQTPVERILAGIWRELLGVKRVGRHDNFFELGGDSILSIQVVSRARQAGVVITPKQLFQHQMLSALAAAAEQSQALFAEQGLVSGEVALTPIQHWFFEQNLDKPQHWNQALLLEAKPGLTPAMVEAALNQVLNHHDALRMRFTRQDGDWQQVLPEEGAPVVFEHIGLAGVPTERQAGSLESAASIQQAQLHLSEGPLLRAAWFDLGEERAGRVLIAIHHLVVDGVSWRILLEDLAGVCRQLMAGQTPALPAKTTSFKYWSEQLGKQAGANGLALDASYWLNPNRNIVPVLPVDKPDGSNLFATESDITVSLTVAETRALLQDAPAAYRTRIDEILLTALALTLRDWLHSDSLLIDLESHGREDITADVDISRTVGWFTTVYPALLTLPNGATLGDALKAVKEQLRAVPMKGIGYGLLRYLSPDAAIKAQLAAQPPAQVIFNHLGQIDTVMTADAPFTPIHDATGNNCDPAGKRAHELAIIGSIAGGRLQLSWRYSRERYRKATLETLAGQYMQQLKALLAHCLLPDSGSYTPSDFPLVELTQTELDAMALTPRQIEDIYPLAPLQYGLLFHSLYAPESGVYNIQVGCRLHGELNIPVFKQAWQQLVEHHPILRTRFHFENRDQPLQVVDKHAQLPISEYDWRAYPPAEQAQRWKRLQADDRENGFDFTRAPLMRLGLVQCSDTGHYFLWSYHHTLLDGWSGPLLIKDLFAVYETIRRGGAASLAVTRPYRDYIAWLQNQDMASAEAYWRTALSGFTVPTPIIGDKPTDNSVQHQAHGYGKQSLSLPAASSQALQQFVKQQQLTINTLVQAAWGLLLSRYSGENDIVFGVTVSGRPAELCGVEDMVGLFINSLPLRIKITPDSSVLDWLQALFAQNQDMRRYEYTPLMQVHGWSELPRGTALFDSLLVFENYPINQALSGTIDGLTIDEVSVIDQTNYPLTVSAFPGTGLRLEITYAADRFEAGTINQMLAHLQRLLEAFAEQPQTRLSELSLLSDSDKQRMLVDWNATEMDYPKLRFLHQLFETQVEKTPDAVAVMFDGQAPGIPQEIYGSHALRGNPVRDAPASRTAERFELHSHAEHGNDDVLKLSYAELNAKANRLAHYLRAKGVGPEVLVGLCVERSLDMAVGILGILKAGGAYVPLDPSYPEQRIAYMLQDARIDVLLSHQGLAAALPHNAKELICLDSDWPAIAHCPADNPEPCNHPLDLAYIIYTSGSTGRPKGAMVTHRNAVHSTGARFAGYREPVDCYLLLSSFAFDSSVAGLFWTLGQGGCLCLPSDDAVKDPAALVELIALHRVSHLLALPSFYALLLNQAGAELQSLKTAIVAGEACSTEVVKQHYALLPGVRLYNEYGPTEATVWSSVYWASPDDLDRPLSIGRPIGNARLYILDRSGNPVPIGVPGELHIGGEGIVRGYWRRPELTAEKFIPDPFLSNGGRLYKTGDLARYRPDGNVEFLGRIDHQVKIRGFRIELGEIEARLMAYPEVDEAVVVAREDQPGNKQLVAYVVCNANSSLTAELLRENLKTLLPDYMVPSAYVFLKGMPLTANGKVDRNLLPAPDRHETQYAPPGTRVEEVLASLWAELLSIGRVGINDNFFTLGGDSILSIQAVGAARRNGIYFTPRQLFENQTIAELAAVAGSENKIMAQQDCVTGEIGLTPIQHWFFELDLAYPHHWNQSLLLTVERRLDIDILEQALHRLVQHHDALRLRFMPDQSGGWRQINLADETKKIAGFIDLTGLSQEQQRLQIQHRSAELQTTLNITDGPLLTAALFELGAGQPQRLLFIVHHLAIDGVSWRILLEDMDTVYRQLEQGGDVLLPAKTTSYKQWSERLQSYAKTGHMQEELDFWLSPGRFEAKPLPIDYPDGSKREQHFKTIALSLNEEKTQALVQQIPAMSRIGIDDMLLSALAQILCRWSGGQSVLLDLDRYGREDIFADVDLTRTVGWFTNVHPVLLSLPAKAGPRDLVDSVKAQLGGIPKSGMGYGILRYLEGGELARQLENHPRSQVLFNYLGQLDKALPPGCPFWIADEPVGAAINKNNDKLYDIEVVAMIVENRLRISWIYSSERFDKATIEQLVRQHDAFLHELIEYFLLAADEEILASARLHSGNAK